MNKNNRWLYVFLFTLPAIFILLTKFLDNDIWYLLAEGRYIIQNGIYHIDPLSLHKGLEVTVQNWLSAAFLWVAYDFFGEMGLIFLLLACNLAICVLLYKLCMLISDNNKIVSLITMLVCDFVLATEYIVTRPQIFSFITLIAVIYVLELYIKKGKWKYLIWLPFISLLQINMHASLWWMIFLFAIPYVIDAFKCEKLKLQGYKKLPLFIALIVSFGFGFLNPYGLKAITFIFNSYGNDLMHSYIMELATFNFSILFCKIIFAILMAMLLIFAYFKNGHVRVRYLCLIAGTALLGFMSIKGFNVFILVAFFPFAYFFKDMTKKEVVIKKPRVAKTLNIVYLVLAIIALGGTLVLYARDSKNIVLVNNTSGALNVLSLYANPETSTVYSSFNNGGAVEFYGFKAYIDPRAEVFLKVNNKKKNVFKEFYELQTGKLDINKFLEKYNFTHLLLDQSDILYYSVDGENIGKGYILMHQDNNMGVRLLARKDQFTDEQLKMIEQQYQESLKALVEQSQEQNSDLVNNMTNGKAKNK